MSKIINKKTVGGFFLAALILLIFFSKTVYTFNLPTVTAVKPQKGTLDKLEVSTGIADWADVKNVYAPVAGTAGKVFVKEGDRVMAGQALFQMDFDRDEAERKLKEIENNKKKLQTDIQNINLQMDKINRSIKGLSDGEDASNYDLKAIDLEIRKAEDALDKAKFQYENGQISLSDLKAAENALQALNLKREKAERTLSETGANYKSEKDALELQLQAKNADLATLALQEKSCRKTLEDYDTYAVITAPVDGTLSTLKVDQGAKVDENAPVLSIGTGSRFTAECTVSLENDFVVPGDACELDNASHVLKGVVSAVTPGEKGKTVKIDVDSGEVTAGETFDVTFEKKSATSYTLVPNEALGQDDDGYFLNVIKRREGILGKEYYIERLDVYIGDSDAQNTAIVKGITFFEPIVLVSDKPVTEGDAVNLENVGDFFED